MSRMYPNSDMVVDDGQGDAKSDQRSGTVLTNPPSAPAKSTLYANSDHVVEPGSQQRAPESESRADRSDGGDNEKASGYDPMTPYRSVFARGTSQDPWRDLADEQGEAIEQVDRAAAEIFQAHDINPTEADQIMQVFRADPSEKNAERWREQSEQYLRSLGPQRDALLRQAKQFLHRDPRVAKLLTETNWGNHPKLLQFAIEKVQKR